MGFDFGFLLYLSLSKPVSQWRYRWLLLPLQLYAALNILLYRWTPDMLAKRHAKRLLEQSLQTRSS